ncbi:Kelch repeat-containing protein [Streptomyces sp. SS]|uniref:Kelch repeat-containing protein n=1 Tax=Streptomyces sp. SS TaxID=260742 RepID=UPI0002D74910|nr:kelch repeat-containing protein [Streptomyces sp. SS]
MRDLLAGGAGTVADPAGHAVAAQAAGGGWTAAGELPIPLVYWHGQYEGPVTLEDGRALAAGGAGPLLVSLDDSAVYDPGPGAWTVTGGLVQERRMHTVTALRDGRALAVGGIPGRQAYPQPTLTHAELFDPGSGTWRATTEMAEARNGHSATLLGDGRVLVAGGQRPRSRRDMLTLATAEVYDPVHETWEPAGAMTVARWDHVTVPLPGGRVLAVGGLVSTAQHGANPALGLCEVYDPGTGTWEPTGSLHAARAVHQAVPLPDGSVLAIGGEAGRAADDARCRPYSRASTEIYDVTTGVWRPGPPLPWGRSYHRAVPTADGVLVFGGTEAACQHTGFASTLLLRDGARHWEPTGPMLTGRWAFGATVLGDGRVLAAGGISRADVAAPEVGVDVPAGPTEVFAP